MPVYFAQPPTGGPVKIGCTTNVNRRLYQLERHYKQPLILLAVMNGGTKEERAIHERFAHLRFGRTEQFRPEPDLLAFIGRPLFASATPVVEAMEAHPSGRDALIAIKCYSAYKRWVEDFARKERIGPTQLIDIALMKLAEAHGFEPPPDR